MKTTLQSRTSGVRSTPKISLFTFGVRAFTLTELLMTVAVLGLILAVLLPTMSKRPPEFARTRCVNNLKNIGLANRLFATDNNDLFPWHKEHAPTTNQHTFPDLLNFKAGDQVVRIFQTLSNELSIPKLLACPADTRKAAPTFASLTTNNISYFVGTSSEETNPRSIMTGDRNMVIDGQRAVGMVQVTSGTKLVEWDRTIHKSEGHVAMGDGSVQQLTSARLRDQLNNTGITNVLIFP